MRARELVGRSVRPGHLGVSTCCGDGATAAHMQTRIPWHARASTTLEMRLPGQSQVLLSGCEKVQWQNMRARSRKVLQVTCPPPTMTLSPGNTAEVVYCDTAAIQQPLQYSTIQQTEAWFQYST